MSAEKSGNFATFYNHEIKWRRLQNSNTSMCFTCIMSANSAICEAFLPFVAANLHRISRPLSLHTVGLPPKRIVCFLSPLKDGRIHPLRVPLRPGSRRPSTDTSKEISRGQTQHILGSPHPVPWHHYLAKKPGHKKRVVRKETEIVLHPNNMDREDARGSL